MSGSPSNQTDHRDRGQEPGDAGASNDGSWGEGSASALESMKRREQRRDAAGLRSHDEHPRASDNSGS